MRQRNGEKGSTLVMFTLALLVMIGVLGLVIDLGWAFFRRQAAQGAADAAVLAAAAASTSSPFVFSCGFNGIACQDPTSCDSSISIPPSNNLQVGCLYAQANGFSPANGQTVLISANNTNPAPGAPGIQVPYWITVSINETETQTFSSVFGNRFLNVGAHATASVFPAPGDCVYALASGGVGLSINGTVNVNTKCGVYVDSNASNALNIVGSGQMTVNGADIYIVGNFSANNNTQVSPAPHTGAAVAADPLQFMPTPAVGACTSSGVSLAGHSTSTINPGVYCGSISLTGGASLVLNPGTYILKNGLSVGGGTSLTGSGVTLYVQSGSFGVAGGASVTLSAPISGTYMGVVIFQDKTDTNKVTLVGGTNQVINGAVYAPAAELDYTGGSTTASLSTLIIGNTVVFVGNSFLTATPKTGFSGGAGGPTLIQ